MSGHDENHERSLEQLMGAGGGLRADFASSALGDCPICRQRVEEALAIEDRLLRAREQERSLAVDLRRQAADGREGRAEAFLREHVGASARSASRRARWLIAGGTIAAGLLIWLSFVARETDPLDGLSNEPMGVGITLVHPVDAVDVYAPFQWQCELPAGGWFEVRVFEEVDGFAGTPLAESGRLGESTWQPDAAIMEGWPDSIVWTLEVFTGANASDSGTPIVARARRRR